MLFRLQSGFNKAAGHISGPTGGKIPTIGVATLYRGTPEPESTPRPRDFAAVFFSTSPEAARQYGEHIAEYEIPMDWLHVLDIDSPEAASLSKEFLKGWTDKAGWDGDNPDDLEDFMMNYWMYPEKGWVRFLTNKGFVGTSIGGDLALFGQGLKWLKRAESKTASSGPIRLYHGTANDFEDFELGHRNGWSIPRNGLYFTDDLRAAQEFGHRVITADVTLANPLDLRNAYGKNPAFDQVFALLSPDYQETIEGGPYTGLIPNTVNTGLAQTEEFVKAAKFIII